MLKIGGCFRNSNHVVTPEDKYSNKGTFFKIEIYA